MKKFYSFLLGTILVMVSSAAYADSNIKINVDDASRVSIKVNGVAINNLVNGENNIPLTASGSFEVKATDGNCLVDVVKKTAKGDTKQNIYSMTSCYVYVNLPDDNGSAINITTNTFDNLRTASCTVKVDNAAKVKMQRSGTFTEVTLKDGNNTIHWIPDVEKEIVISTVSYTAAPLYSIVVDGLQLPKGNTSYTVKPKDGGLIDITANYPDKDCRVKFAFNTEEAKGVVSSVTVDGRPVTNYTDPNFSVKAGSRLTITFNTTTHAIDAVKVNGTPNTIYGSLNLTITDDMNIDIAAHKLGKVKAMFYVDHAENIILFQGWDYNQNHIALQDGMNTIELPETNCVVKVRAKNGCKIKVLRLNGKQYTNNIDGVYEITLKNGMNIGVETSAPKRDKTATVFVDSKQLADRFFYFNRQDRTEVQLNNGENTIKFGEDDNPFTLAFDGTDLSKLKVRLNGKEVEATGGGGHTYELEFANGDRLEIWFNGISTNGIANPAAANKTNKRVVYRLDGTRVDEQKNLPKGLYIINGKKIFINK